MKAEGEEKRTTADRKEERRQQETGRMEGEEEVEAGGWLLNNALRVHVGCGLSGLSSWCALARVAL